MSRPRASESSAPRRRNATGPARHLATSPQTEFARLSDLLANDPESRARVRAAARRRGLTVEQLARRILETIFEDDLVSAVLDDTGEPRGRH